MARRAIYGGDAAGRAAEAGVRASEAERQAMLAVLKAALLRKLLDQGVLRQPQWGSYELAP